MPLDQTIKKPSENKSIIRMIVGVIFIALGIFLLLSFFSFYFNGNNDQSQLDQVLDHEVTAQNIFGKIGATVAEWCIRDGIGIMAFFLPLFLLALGVKIITKVKQIKPFKLLSKSIFFLIWIPIFLGFILKTQDEYYGAMGFETNYFVQNILGKTGMGIILFFALIIYLVIQWRITPEKVKTYMDKKISSKDFENIDDEFSVIDASNFTKNETIEGEIKPKPSRIKEKTENQVLDLPISSVKPTEISTPEKVVHVLEVEDTNETSFTITNLEAEKKPLQTEEHVLEITPINQSETLNHSGGLHEKNISLEIEKINLEEDQTEKLSNELVEKYGEYDPRLDLPNYKSPPLNLLKQYDNQNTTIDQRELETNKNKIVETLANYGIGISQIKATIGPTVTLYEIVPEAGVRISKIKNLEDDIALSLSALGIRIIAPIPGKGTIGIEVPNSNPSMVSMHSVIASTKFQNANMDLPIAFGKTISNETFVADLAKMPHLLMAGATGQGKSVGLNAIITSLIYKKHPSELKFVFVDPKKVELTLYSKIERHYLAKIPNTDEAIITDNSKVINTLNSLCVEMDDRYELLKNAMVRNLKEYNAKFKARKLNPENGHRFLPYIVLVVDEFADLIMTAGKEVELPIARLAQLARAIGIHLIIATQRPSVNVITGMIKANFPARVAFRVTSKIDSRTILDGSGADQLIGKGDMLFTTGNDLVRLQCAFVDTPEVDDITDFIGSQKGYPSALLLPEYESDEVSATDVDLNDRDALFEDAARLIVAAQQGSASLLQRKLKLGYNRAGRLIDQLEAAGIVGPFEGSKARQVLVMDETSLSQILDNLP